MNRESASRACLPFFMGLFSAALLSACGGGEGGGEAVHEAKSPLELAFGPYPLMPGEEQDFCEYFEIDSDEPTQVTRIAQSNLGKTHHAFLYKTTLDHAPGRGDCPNVIDKIVNSTPLYASTAAQGPSEMPEGVAMALEPRQKMFVNIHLLNPTGSAAETEVKLTLDRGDPSVAWTPVGFFELTTLEIYVPPHGEGSAGNTCKFPADVNVVSMTSHSHSRTTLVTANKWDGSMEGEEVYRNTNWAEPAVTFYKDPIIVPKDQGFSFKCNYANMDSYPVEFGDAANDEMCYILGYYYPGPDTIICSL